MSEPTPPIPVDRELLRRLIEGYLALDAENRAFRGEAARAAASQMFDPRQYDAEHKAGISRESARQTGLARALADALDSGDAEAFQQRLSCIFPASP